LLLTKMGASVRLIAPPTLLPPHPEKLGVNSYTDMCKGLEGCDIIMMLRIQKERMHNSYIPSLGEFFRFYGLTAEKLACAKEDALVMHPGPINRGVEIDTDIADDINRSLILDQVEMGVAVRQAVFELLLR
jgi:aspartate carbamoyltransferase catalytic subunit